MTSEHRILVPSIPTLMQGQLSTASNGKPFGGQTREPIPLHRRDKK